MRDRVRNLARAAGLEDEARQAYRRVRRLTENGVQRRARTDDEKLKVLLAATLHRGSNCVDIGANVGSVLDLIVRYAPEGDHIAFEPLPDLAAELRGRLEVDVRSQVVSDEPGEIRFQRHSTMHSQSSLRVRDGGPIEELELEAVRLDDVLPNDYVPSLIKIDVEGAELQVLRGALETLRTHRPIVVFEHGDHAVSQFGVTHDDVFDLLVGSAGLRVFDMDGNGPFSREEFARVASPPGDRFNFFARP